MDFVSVETLDVMSPTRYMVVCLPKVPSKVQNRSRVIEQQG